MNQLVPCRDRVANASKSAGIRVLIADDHFILREGLAAIIALQDDMDVVDVAQDGQQAVEMWRQYRPDVTLMDLRMPVLDGAAAIARIREEEDQARIVVLTTFDDEEDIYRGMCAGAKAYLLKDVHREELLDCIRKVHAGETWFSSKLAAKLARRVSSVELSKREIDVLSLMVKGKCNKDIAAALFIGDGTVKSHVKNIFAKLNVVSRTEAVTTAVRRGLVRL